jgi:phosphatidylinositol alpha-1,6-mannosyltransferase
MADYLQQDFLHLLVHHFGLWAQGLPSTYSVFTSSMNILFVTDKFIPEHGGSQNVFGQIYRHLLDDEVTVVTRHWEGHAECDAAYPHRVIRVRYPDIPKIRGPLLWRALAGAARQISTEERFDQIHLGQTVETAPQGTSLACRLGIPSVVHTFAEDVTQYVRHPLWGPLMRRGVRNATVVTTISRFTQQRLTELGVASDRIVLLYPGVTAENWQRTGNEVAIRKKLRLDGKRVLLTVSRLIPRKGHRTVLDAMPNIIQKVPNAVYVIVGEGREESGLRTLTTKLGLDAHVRIVGSIPNGETVDFYHACDLFIMPSREMPNGDVEGFGLVFLEANACGKPVIGGNSGGTPDAIAHGESGFLVDPTSSEEVASRAIEVLTNPELGLRLGEQGRRRALTAFTWERSAQTLRQAMALAKNKQLEVGHA